MPATPFLTTFVVHAVWDLGAWLLAVALLFLLYRRHRGLFAQTRLSAVTRGYFLALPLGGLCGAYAMGSANLWLSGKPALAVRFSAVSLARSSRSRSTNAA